MAKKINKKSLDGEMMKQAEKAGFNPVVIFHPPEHPNCDDRTYSTFIEGWQAAIEYLEKKKAIKYTNKD